MSSEKLTALVTGGNRGIGKEVVRKLSVLGYIVYLGSRDVVAGNNARNEIVSKHPDSDIRVIQLTTNDPTSLLNAVDFISKDNDGKLDVLVNNAAILMERDYASLTNFSVLKETMDVNFYGTFLTTQSFLPLLRNGTKKTIVNVSSVLGSLTAAVDKSHYNYGIPTFSYSASKSAINTFTAHLSVELEKEGFKINSVHPGYVATDMNNHKGSLTVDEGTKGILRMIQDPPGTGGFYQESGPLPW
eukprot:gene2378-2940_t